MKTAGCILWAGFITSIILTVTLKEHITTFMVNNYSISKFL